MSGALSIQLGLAAAVLFGVAAAVLVALTYGPVRSSLQRLAPTQRARWLFTLSALPAGSAVVLTALCFLPKLLDVLWSGLDHCAEHGGSHPHLCLVHLPGGAGSMAGWLVLGALLAILLAKSVHLGARLRRASRTLALLLRGAQHDRDRGAWVVPSEVPFALTAGLLRPRTFVSEALLAALPEDMASAVLAHEAAHARRRDVLLRLVATVLSLAHLPATRRLLLEDLRLATEQACDEDAGEQLGDRLQVAQALVGLERLLSSGPADVELVGVSFAGSSVVPRVEALLAAPPATHGRLLVVALAAGLVGALALGADTLHHLTETLLGLLLVG